MHIYGLHSSAVCNNPTTVLGYTNSIINNLIALLGYASSKTNTQSSCMTGTITGFRNRPLTSFLCGSHRLGTLLLLCFAAASLFFFGSLGVGLAASRFYENDKQFLFSFCFRGRIACFFFFLQMFPGFSRWLHVEANALFRAEARLRWE